MRRQIGFEIRDMWYNLGNLTHSLCQYCSLSLLSESISLLHEFMQTSLYNGHILN